MLSFYFVKSVHGIYLLHFYTHLHDIIILHSFSKLSFKILEGYWVNFPFKIASMWQFSCQISSIIGFILEGGYLWYNAKAVGHTEKLEPPWPWSYGRLIYIYLFNQYLSHLKLRVWLSSMNIRTGTNLFF